MKTSYPNIIVVLQSREKVQEFRGSLGDNIGIIAIGPEHEILWKLAGIDAFYLNLTRAERWGSKPIEPHSVAILKTNQADQQAGYPRFIITGLLLKQGEPNTLNFGFPILFESVFNAVEQLNNLQPNAIRTLGFFEHELKFAGSTLSDSACLLAQLYKTRFMS